MKKTSIMIAMGTLFCVHVAGVQAQVLLGPANPTLDGSLFSPYNAEWNFGASGNSFTNSQDSGGFIANTGLINLGATATGGNADFRANTFSLGLAANGAQSITFGFNFLFSEAVQSGNNIRVGLRFWENSGGSQFAGEQNIYIGSNNGNTNLVNEWQAIAVNEILAPANAGWADIRVSVNTFGDDTWTSGSVSFDNFAVTTIPEPGTYALIGGLLALGAVLLRRKLIRT